MTAGARILRRPSGGVATDHGTLTGLGDDDHPQYALADGSRGNFAAVGHTHDHGSLTGLGDDDHPQYAFDAHTHNAADIVAGTIAPARLGAGSGGATKFLREDSTWQPLPAGANWSSAVEAGAAFTIATNIVRATSTGAAVGTLPDATTWGQGVPIFVRKQAAGGSFAVRRAGGDTINGQTSDLVLFEQGEWYMLVAHGTDWAVF